MKKPALYKEDPNHKFNATQLPENVYSLATSSLVRVCTDIIPINSNKEIFYLAKRAVHPMKGWWWTGGRMLVGEYEEESARRCFKRETSLDLPTERFIFVRINRLWWKLRKEKPEILGCDDLTYCFTVELTESELEIASSNLITSEYESSFSAFDKKRLEKENVHTSIKNLYDEVFSKSA